MRNLSKLAQKPDLEGQPYEGGGLKRWWLSLTGELQHQKLRSENLTVDLSKNQLWQKLYESLEKEQILTERVVLDQKNAELMGYSLKNLVIPI